MPDSAHAGWEAWDPIGGSRLEPDGSGQYRQRHLGRSIRSSPSSTRVVCAETSRSPSRRALIMLDHDVSVPVNPSWPSARARQLLRRQFRGRRRSLTAREQASHAHAVTRHFFTSGLILRGHTIGLYLANDGEVDLARLFARLLKSRRQVALPVVHRDGQMALRRCRAETPLLPNRYGILEPGPGEPTISPLAIDVLLLPLVAFDAYGTRLGMGAGYYDRYLGRVPPALRPLLVGIAHETQRSSDPLPRNSWDVSLDGIITETGWQPIQPSSA
jgi:5-formyltetrahydrofolate cyclo-ligase